MRSDDVDRWVTSALLWDVPALRSIGTPGSRAFIEAFHLRPRRQEEDHPDDPLWQAACGIHAFTQENVEETDRYCRVLMEMGPWPSVLGACLRAFTGMFGREALLVAEEAAGLLPDRQLRAHYFAKLATFAWDQGFKKEAERYLRESLVSAPARSSIAQALHLVGTNLFGWPINWTGRVRYSRLVDLPWVEGLAQNSAREQLVDLVSSRIGSPWTWSLRIGQPEITSALAAQLQAVWAGALWTLPRLRLQLGATLLMGGAESPEEVTFGIAMWVLGRGKETFRLIRYAEAGFSEESADQLLRDQLLYGERVPDTSRFIEAARACWDLMSPEMAGTLLEKFPADAMESPLADDTRALWVLLAVRNPELWHQRFIQLQRDTQVALIAALPPGVVDHLPRKLVKKIASLSRTAMVRGDDRRDTLLGVYTGAIQRLGEESTFRMDALTHSPYAVATLAHNYPWAVENIVSSEVLERLTTAAAQEVSEGKSGRRNLYAVQPIVQLGLLLAALKRVPRKPVKLIVDAAVDGSLPSDIRFEAVQSSYALARAGHLKREDFDRLFDAPRDAAGSFFGNVSESLIRAGTLVALAHSKRFVIDFGELIELSRDQDVRTREYAVYTAAELLRKRPKETPSMVILSALYDPADNVTASALESLATGAIPTSDVLASLPRRICQLYFNGAVEVRVQAVRAAAKLDSAIPSASLREVLAAGTTDRSWRVRTIRESIQVADSPGGAHKGISRSNSGRLIQGQV